MTDNDDHDPTLMDQAKTRHPTPNTRHKIVFVYNADSGLIKGLKDLIHKMVSPSTYECNLCAVTYDTFGMRSEWREFVDSLPHEVNFFHKDDLREQFGIDDVELPAVFLKNADGQLELWIEAASINRLDSLDQLKAFMVNRLEAGFDHVDSRSGRLTTHPDSESN